MQFLLSKGADNDLCLKDRVSAFYVAFERRHYNHDLKDCFNEKRASLNFLLQKDNILNNMYDTNSFFSLFVSSQVERVTRLIFDK